MLLPRSQMAGASPTGRRHQWLRQSACNPMGCFATSRLQPGLPARALLLRHLGWATGAPVAGAMRFVPGGGNTIPAGCCNSHHTDLMTEWEPEATHPAGTPVTVPAAESTQPGGPSRSETNKEGGPGASPGPVPACLAWGHSVSVDDVHELVPDGPEGIPIAVVITEEVVHDTGARGGPEDLLPVAGQPMHSDLPGRELPPKPG